jgi:Chaperone of endosialidase
MRLLALRTWIFTATISTALAAAATATEPIGTGFTYQGQLKHQGAPLGGNVDLRFVLFDVEFGGVALDELAKTDVTVTNGLFTVELDFGAVVFNGDARWLEVAVRFPHDPTDTWPFTELTPRQAITVTPYALQTRGLFVNEDGNVGLGTTFPNSTLHVVSSENSAIFAKNSASIGHGLFGRASATSGTNYGVYGLTDSTGGVGVFGGASPNSGNTTGVSGTSHSTTGRGVVGMAFATSGTNYGVRGDTFSPDGYAGYFTGGRNFFEGKVGIGTESPNYQLHVETSNTRAVYATSSNDDGYGVYGEVTAATGLNFGVHGTSASTAGRGVFGYASASSGTTYGVQGTSDSSSGYGVSGTNRADSGTNYGVHGHTNSPDGYAGHFTGGRNYFEGKVGIGVESPESKLDVDFFGPRTIDARNSSASGIGVYGMASATGGATFGGEFVSVSQSGTGVRGHATHPNGMTYAVKAETSSPNGYAGYFKGGRNYFEGRVGIGTTAPASDVKLHLAGANANIRMRDSGGNPYIEIGDTSIAKGYLQWFSSTNRLMLYTSGHSYPVAIGRTDMGGIFVDTDANGSDVGIGTEAPQYKLHVAGSAGKPGGGSWTNSSDRRLKKNIHDLDGSLDRLMKLRSVSFEYKDPESINELPGERIGMIAQEVEEVFPDWIDEGGHGYKTLTFRGFEALAVDALRELRAEKDSQIEALRKENAAMQRRLARLESLLATEKEDTQ